MSPILSDLILPVDSFTFLSPAHDTTGWLDHIIVSEQSLDENFVDWSNFNATQRKKYENNITALFSNIDICTNTECSIDHLTHLDNAYGALVGSFHHATNDFKMTWEKKFKVIPG